MKATLRQQLTDWAEKYNDPAWFQEDPIIFPKELLKRGGSLKDIEIAAVFSSHFAWGRRAMIVRDCERFFEFLEWKPEEYVMSGDWRKDDSSIHRTVKWSETAQICCRLKEWYSWHGSLETLDAAGIRESIYGQKPDRNAANKKINLMRRWLARQDGIVDLGVWKNTDPATLTIPLDVHVHRQAGELGICKRKQMDAKCAEEITDAFREIFPEDPAKGDFALFGYGVSRNA